MKKILLFAGTTEGRLLTEYLIKKPVVLHVSVATEYGRSLLPSAPNLTVSCGRMSSAEMAAYMKQENFDLVLDATHPYASEATAQIQEACRSTVLPYKRILRDCSASRGSEIFVENTAEAVAWLAQTDGPVFLTTGSKNLQDFMELPRARERLFIRVLPNEDILSTCRRLGLPGSHIFCMQGPFSTDMNLATIAHIQRVWTQQEKTAAGEEKPLSASAPLYLVTKQSGSTGGFDEKLAAAEKAKIPVLIIGRPQDTPGFSLSEIMAWLEDWCPDLRLVTLIGMGMSAAQLTAEADAALRSCDMIIGARRMLAMAEGYHKPSFCSYDYPAIANFMQKHKEYRHFAVLFSGDAGFYSGAAPLRRQLEGLPFKVQTISGIASPIHFLNTIGKPWEEVHMISCHGQQPPVVSHICRHEKTLAILGKGDDAAAVCRQLIRYGLPDCRIYIGSNLQQADEMIVSGRPEDFTEKSFSALSIIYIENPRAPLRPVTHGLPDSAFLRDKVPMTKSEIRSIVLSKLALTPRAIFHDIGAGTGSVAIEAARQIPEGRVYAIEKNPLAVSLIRENCQRLQADNLTIIEGNAPEALEGLPAATHAFIGGSSGELDSILKHLQGNAARIVMTAISLETMAQLMTLQKELNLPEPEIIQVQVNGTKKAGAHHLMQAQNPIYIITWPAP